MADMEETGQTTTGFEDDPAAAFLAREQDELADIAGDTLGLGVGNSEVSEGAHFSRLLSSPALPSTDRAGDPPAAARPRRFLGRGPGTAGENWET